MKISARSILMAGCRHRNRERRRVRPVRTTRSAAAPTPAPQRSNWLPSSSRRRYRHNCPPHVLLNSPLALLGPAAPLGTGLPPAPTPQAIAVAPNLANTIDNIYISVEPWVQYGFEVATCGGAMDSLCRLVRRFDHGRLLLRRKLGRQRRLQHHRLASRQRRLRREPGRFRRRRRPGVRLAGTRRVEFIHPAAAVTAATRRARRRKVRSWLRRWLLDPTETVELTMLSSEAEAVDQVEGLTTKKTSSPKRTSPKRKPSPKKSSPTRRLVTEEDVTERRRTVTEEATTEE